MSNTLNSYLGVRRVASVINRMIEMNKRKPKEAALIYHWIKRMLFFEGFDSPRYAKILYDWLKNVDKQVTVKNLLSNTINDAQIKGIQLLIKWMKR